MSVKQAGDKVPSGRIVSNIVQRIMERTKVANPYHVGEVCQILPKDNPDLRGRSNCWCIVNKVNDFSCSVVTWDGELTVGLQHLKSFDYLDDECKQMQQISDRINKIYSRDMEKTAYAILKSLGEIKRPYLTPLEEKLLTLLEQEFSFPRKPQKQLTDA